MSDDNKNVGGFPSNNKSAGQTQPNPEKEAGDQNPGVEINRKTERSTDPEKSGS